jgi:molybdopterin molybdotransferase
MLNVKSYEETVKIIVENFAALPLENERIKLDDAVGRVTAEDILSKEDVPGFNRSSVDGYAVMAHDTYGAAETLPAQLNLIGEVKMGEKTSFKLEMGQAAYVPTGGDIPEGVDAVVMVEYTENLHDGFIYINKSVAPGNNMVFQGDDMMAGNVVLKASRRLRTQDIGALAAMGYTEVAVKRKLKIGIISTGDELVTVDEPAGGARVRDVNSHFLYAEALKSMAEPILYGIVKDGYERIMEAVIKAAEACDLVLISGGSSVGQRDETYRVISSLDNCKMLVHGIALKPGKPAILAKAGNKAMVGLPGHPVSAYFIYKVIVQPLLDVMYGTSDRFSPCLPAEMVCNYPSNNGRHEFLPVRLETVNGRTFASPVFSKSGLITLLTTADGYVQISRGSEGLAIGQKVDVVLF